MFIAAGCNQSPAQTSVAEAFSEADYTDAESLSSRNDGDDNTAAFSEVLAQYQVLNTRLETAAYRLQKANAALCPVTERSVGMTVHTVYDYPDKLQPIARALLGVASYLTIRTVREGSPAAAAGLQSGDRLLELGGNFAPSGRTAKSFYAALERQAFTQETVSAAVRRGAEDISAVLNPETICGYQFNVFYSERINGHTDGQEIWITSELIRAMPSDTNLALIAAHEMAHAIAGHAGLAQTKALELEADRMAMILIVRAGYDIDRVVEDWARAPHQHGEHSEAVRTGTHPSAAERLENFQQVRAAIKAAEQSGRVITFDLIE